MIFDCHWSFHCIWLTSNRLPSELNSAIPNVNRYCIRGLFPCALLQHKMNAIWWTCIHMSIFVCYSKQNTWNLLMLVVGLMREYLRTYHVQFFVEIRSKLNLCEWATSITPMLSVCDIFPDRVFLVLYLESTLYNVCFLCFFFFFLLIDINYCCLNCWWGVHLHCVLHTHFKSPIYIVSELG